MTESGSARGAPGPGRASPWPPAAAVAYGAAGQHRALHAFLSLCAAAESLIVVQIALDLVRLLGEVPTVRFGKGPEDALTRSAANGCFALLLFSFVKENIEI